MNVLCVYVKSDVFVSFTKRKIVDAYKVWSCEIMDHTIAVGNANMPNARDYPSDAGEGRPGYAQREFSIVFLYWKNHVLST